MNRRKKFPFEISNPKKDPLVNSCKRVVRFEEVDALKIVWHGRYPSYLEDGRMSFGKQYGLSYYKIKEQNFVAPIAEMNIKYHKPLEYGDEMIISTSLHYTEMPRMNFSYRIETKEKGLCTSAYSVQAYLDPDGNVMLYNPQFMDDFLKRWGSSS